MYSLFVVLRMYRDNNVIFIGEVNMREYSFFALRMYRDEMNALKRTCVNSHSSLYECTEMK